MPIHILLDGEARINASSIEITSLFVETPDRGSHAFGADTNHVNIFWQGGTDVFQMAEQKAVR